MEALFILLGLYVLIAPVLGIWVLVRSYRARDGEREQNQKLYLLEQRIAKITSDIAVLSRNLLEIPTDTLLGTEVLYTIVGGDIVHTRESK